MVTKMLASTFFLAQTVRCFFCPRDIIRKLRSYLGPHDLTKTGIPCDPAWTVTREVNKTDGPLRST